MSNQIILEGIRKTIFGAGAIDQLGQACKALKASKALVVVERLLAKTDVGVRATESIRKSRVKAVLYPDVIPEPSPTLADIGTDLARVVVLGHWSFVKVQSSTLSFTPDAFSCKNRLRNPEEEQDTENYFPAFRVRDSISGLHTL